MESIIGFIILLFIILFLLPTPPKISPSKKKKAAPIPAQRDEVAVINRETNDKGLLVSIDVDDIYILHCQFYNNGSPWVDVSNSSVYTSSHSYNVKTYRWKNEDEPDGGPYQSKINRLLREEWRAAWIGFGEPEYDSGKKKPVPAPTSVDYSIDPIVLKYDFGNLSNLPDNYLANGSSGETYTLNLKNLECSCPDFIKRRSDFPPGDIRRLCKHQAKAIVSLGKNMKITDNVMIQNFVRYASSSYKGVMLYDDFFKITINEDIRGENPFYMTTETGSPWVNILFFTPRSRIRRGYNIEEQRWAYGENPFPSGSRRKFNLAIQMAYNEVSY